METDNLSAQPTTAIAATTFTDVQRKDLLRLRERYSLGADFLTERDYVRLRFARWLYQTGRVDP